MVTTALLFAGQATQYVGMGKALFETYPEARVIFEEADDALGERLSSIIFDGPADTLTLTANTQPAVLTTACAAWQVLHARGFVPTVVAGHSLGEYGALVAAGALQFRHAVQLTRLRGQFMQAAVPEGVGAMAAIQRLTVEQISAICEMTDGLCVPAVYNAPKLTVVSGETAAVAAVSARCEAERGIVIPLSVSAPFHSPMLASAGEALRSALADIPMAPITIPYVCNVDATWHETTTASAIKERLVQQVVAPVKWSQSIELMLSNGIERFWHLGPGRSNLGHVKRQARRAPMATMDNADDVAQILTELGG
ncbi:MAG: ACP S-malonyltransferase [Myxococcota bacterium]|nr:ACP S-malonyltransferase [Myxococcota bacterium]